MQSGLGGATHESFMCAHLPQGRKKWGKKKQKSAHELRENGAKLSSKESLRDLHGGGGGVSTPRAPRRKTAWPRRDPRRGVRGRVQGCPNVLLKLIWLVGWQSSVSFRVRVTLMTLTCSVSNPVIHWVAVNPVVSDMTNTLGSSARCIIPWSNCAIRPIRTNHAACTHDSSLSGQSHLAPVSNRTDHEKVLHLHHSVRHPRRRPQAPATSEEHGGAQPELHLGELHAEADARTGAPGREEQLLLGRHPARVQEARLVEAVALLAWPSSPPSTAWIVQTCRSGSGHASGSR